MLLLCLHTVTQWNEAYDHYSTEIVHTNNTWAATFSARAPYLVSALSSLSSTFLGFIFPKLIFNKLNPWKNNKRSPTIQISENGYFLRPFTSCPTQDPGLVSAPGAGCSRPVLCALYCIRSLFSWLMRRPVPSVPSLWNLSLQKQL